MAFMRSSVNGLLIQIPDRLAAAKLPMAFTTEQNGHLFDRDRITGDPLVSLKLQQPTQEAFEEAVPAREAIAKLATMPERTRLEANAAKTTTKKPSARVAPEQAAKAAATVKPLEI